MENQQLPLKEKEGRIERIEKVGESIYRYTVSIEAEDIPQFCYAIRLGIPGEDLTRPYSPVKVSNREVVCIIKIYPVPDGAEEIRKKMFTPNLKKLAVGDKIRILWYTRKHLIEQILNPNTKQICMVSAGTGITPMMQVLEYANGTKCPQKFINISVSSNEDTVILKGTDEYPSVRMEIHNVFVGENENTRETGLEIVKEKIKHLLHKDESTLFLVCGPDLFVKEIAGDRKGLFGGILHKLSVKEENCVKF